MEMLLSVLRPVMSYVSDEALEDALALAGRVPAAASASPSPAPAPAPPSMSTSSRGSVPPQGTLL
jgi:hypothetical protein